MFVFLKFYIIRSVRNNIKVVKPKPSNQTSALASSTTSSSSEDWLRVGFEIFEQKSISANISSDEP